MTTTKTKLPMPWGNRILVRRDEAEQKSRGGVILPDISKEKPTTGLVLKVGRGRALDDGNLAPIDIGIGETVTFSRYGGTEIEVDGETLVILSVEDVLAVS